MCRGKFVADLDKNQINFTESARVRARESERERERERDRQRHTNVSLTQRPKFVQKAVKQHQKQVFEKLYIGI